ncbi:MAG: carbohydrate ABC transporter permease [Limibaculum sp.]
MTAATAALGGPERGGFFDTLAPGGKRALFLLALVAVLFIFIFPVFWLMLTSLKPGWEVFYVHRGTEFTLSNYVDVLQEEIVVRAFINSFVIATLATVISLTVTVTSGYMLSRFRGRIASTWFATIYLFRCIPYISWVLPLYFVTQWWGIYDSYLGLLLPHIAVHICFFSWIMKGFFDGIDPSMEHAALIDGCTRWGAFRRVALPAAIPGIAALAILCWLYTWNEFLFALILTSHQTPMITAVMAQFVHELGTEWHLMSATAVMAMGPAMIVTVFGQKYVIKGLRV